MIDTNPDTQREHSKFLPPRVSVSLDYQEFGSKPNEDDARKMSSRLSAQRTDIDIVQLAESLVSPHGRTFCPAIFKNPNSTINNKNWEGQQIFVLDIDEGLTFEEAKQRWTKYDIVPAFVYSTFSDIDHTRFRIVFIFEQMLTSLALHRIVSESLYALFPEADPTGKSPAHMFYGGKNLLYLDDDRGFISIQMEKLINNVCWFIRSKDKKNAKVNIQRYCKKINVQEFNGYPKIAKSTVESFSPAEPPDDFFISPYYTLGTIFGEVLLYNNKISQEILYIHKPSTPYSKGGKRRASGGTKNSIDAEARTYQENISRESVVKHCRLTSEFLSGEYWAYHHELFGLATNLSLIKGGKELFFEGLTSREEYANDSYGNKLSGFLTSWYNQIIKQNYKPQYCKEFCPYRLDCLHGRTLLETCYLQRGSVHVLEEKQFISLEEGEKKLSEYIHRCLEAPLDGKIHVVKADTGLGKTEVLLNSDLNNVDVLAFPTHRLKDEISNLRINDRLDDFLIVPEIPEVDPQIDKLIKDFYAVGAYEKANFLIYKNMYEYPEFRHYMKILEEARTQTQKPILTTHDRALFDRAFHGKSILFDEDPMNSIIKKSTTTLGDLELLKRVMYQLQSPVYSYPFDVDQALSSLESFIVFVRESPNYELCSLDLRQFPLIEKIKDVAVNLFIYEKKAYRLFQHDKAQFSNIFGFFTCSFFIKDSSGEKIHYIKKSELDFSRIIITSATANKVFYERLFGENLCFHDVGRVQPRGKIIQYLDKSFSKKQMNDEVNILTAQMVAKCRPIITHKRYKNQFPENTVFTFGSITGLDELKGRDIVVAGTYRFNEISYFLDASVLGIPCNPSQENQEYRIVQYNGKKFHFYAFQNPELQNLQLSVVESELEQAVGRARIVRENCTVILLSSFPLDGAEYRKVSDDYDISTIVDNDKNKTQKAINN